MKEERKEYIRENGFIVISLTYLFELMEKISIFYFIRWIGKRINKNADGFLQNGMFSEIWVLGNLFFAIIAQNVVKGTDVKWLSIIFMLYAIERIWEMFVYQTNVLFFTRLRNYSMATENQNLNENESVQSEERNQENKNSDLYMVISATRTVILLIINMAEYILDFAIIYAAAINLGWITGMVGEVWQSFQIFMNMGDLQNYSDSRIFVFAYIETILGMFMNIACLAYFIGMLPDTKSRVQSSGGTK